MLKPCTECGAEISTRAKTCPKCGIKDPFKSSAELKMADVGKGLMGCGCAIPMLLFSVLLLWGIVATMFESC